jgi:hypothetical protein
MLFASITLSGWRLRNWRNRCVSGASNLKWKGYVELTATELGLVVLLLLW